MRLEIDRELSEIEEALELFAADREFEVLVDVEDEDEDAACLLLVFKDALFDFDDLLDDFFGFGNVSGGLGP